MNSPEMPGMPLHLWEGLQPRQLVSKSVGAEAPPTLLILVEIAKCV